MAEKYGHNCSFCGHQNVSKTFGDNSRKFYRCTQCGFVQCVKCVKANKKFASGKACVNKNCGSQKIINIGYGY